MSAVISHPDLAELRALYNAGEYQQALQRINSELAPALANLTNDPSSSSATLLVANLYRDMARYTDAEPYYFQALGHLAAAGKDRAIYAQAMADLAELYEKSDRYQQAEELYVASRLAYQGALESDPLGLARCLTRLAVRFDSDGRRAEAVTCLREARTLLTSCQPDPLVTADLLISEAQVLSRTEGLATAIGRMREAVELRRRFAGDSHPETNYARLLLGSTLLTLNHLDEAAQLIERVREPLAKDYGPKHPRAISALEATAVLRASQGVAREAESFARKALAAQRETLGDDHTWTGDSYRTLSHVLLEDQRLVAAEEALDAALEIYQRVFGVRHPLTIELRIEMADLQQLAGRPREAETLAREAVADLEVFAELRLERARGWLVVARLVADGGDAVEGEKLATRAISLAAGCGREPSLCVPAHILLYRLAIGRRDLTAAISHLSAAEAALKNSPVGDPLRQELAITYAGLDWMQGTPERAMTRARDSVREAGDGRRLPWALVFLAEQLLQAGELEEAEATYERALSIQQRQSGQTHPAIAATLRGLARVHSARGNPAAAEVRVRKAFQLLLDERGEDHPDTADALADLATLAQQAGNLIAAEEMHRKVVEVRRETLGETHPQTAAARHGLAIVLSTRGDSTAAVTTLEAALAPLEKTHPEWSPLRHTLGMALHDRGESGRAVELLGHVLRDYEAVVGDTHDGLLPVLSDLVRLHASLGDHLEARRILGRMRRILASSPIPQPVEEFRLLSALADSHLQLSDSTRGLMLAEQALSAARTTLTDRNSNLIPLLTQTADACGAEKRYSRAATLLSEAEDIVRWVGGERHPMLAALWLERAVLEVRRGHSRTAVPLYERAADLARSELGEDHPDHAAARKRQAEHLQSLGMHTDAARHLRTYLNAIRRTVGADHPAVAVAMLAAADAQRMAGDLSAAEDTCREALAVLRRSDRPADALMANALHLLGVILRLRGRLPDSALAFGQALEIDRESPGGDNGGAADTRRELACVDAARGDTNRALNALVDSLAVQESLLNGSAALTSSSARENFFDAIRRSFDQVMTLAVQTGSNVVASVALRWNAIELTDLLPDGRTNLKHRYPLDADSIDRLFDLYLQIVRRRWSGAGLEGLALHRDLLSRWEADRDVMEAKLAPRIPELARLRAWRGVGEGSVRAALPRGSNFVELVRFRPVDFAEVCAGRDGHGLARYAAVVSQGSDVVVLDVGPAATLEGKGGGALLRSILSERLSGPGHLVVGHGGLPRPVWGELSREVVGVRSCRELVSPLLTTQRKGLLARLGGWFSAAWNRSV